MTTTSHTSAAPAATFPPTSPANHTPKEPVKDARVPGPSSTASSVHHPQDQEGSSSPSNQSIPWTPAHPCYPHPNPHVPRQDPRAKSTRVIRVQRDWSVAGDLYPQFSETYPEILAPWINEREFRQLIASVNDTSREAFEPTTGRAWLDSVMGVLTGWLWEDCGFTTGKTGARKCERVITAWNAECRRRRIAERGTPAVAVEKTVSKGDADVVECIPLRRTAWMTLDFVIPDPKISIVPEEPELPSLHASRGLTPRGSGERLGERERRASRKNSRDRATTAAGPVPARAADNDADDWTRDVEKGGEVGVAM